MRATAITTAMSEATTQGDNMSRGEKALLALPPFINETPIVKTKRLKGILSTEAQNTALEPNKSEEERRAQAHGFFLASFYGKEYGGSSMP